MKYFIKYGVMLFVVQFMLLSGAVAGIELRTQKAESSVAPLVSPSVSPTPKKVTRAAPMRVIANDTPVITGDPVGIEPTQQQVVAVEPTPVPDPPAPAESQQCIITVHGTRYNVTEFRSFHSGGDIFTCGAEMTGVFDSQHSMGTLRKMSPYIVN